MADPDMLQANIGQRLELALQYQLVTNQTNLILVHVREEHTKAEGLPALGKIAHMQAAGWGGLGSVVGASGVGTPPESCAMSVPAVWRTIGRTAAAADMDDDMPFDGIDDFEIPAFLRKQVDGSQPGTLGIQYSKRLDRAALPKEVGPVATPLEILCAFDAAAQKAFAVSRFVKILQALRLSDALVSVRDNFALGLGSDAKAWAVLIKWLAESMADQFTLSRQGERLLSHCLKGENLPILEELHQRLTTLWGSEVL
jgi:Ca-activated chloride channel homolog